MHWLMVWRLGIAPRMAPDALRSLAEACRADDKRLLQGRTTLPVTLMRLVDIHCEGCCPVGWLGWFDGLKFVEEIEEYVEKTARIVDCETGQGSIRVFFNWWDETDRRSVLTALAEEVEAELSRRETHAGSI